MTIEQRDDEKVHEKMDQVKSYHRIYKQERSTIKREKKKPRLGGKKTMFLPIAVQSVSKHS